MNKFLEKPKVCCLGVWDKKILAEEPPSARSSVYRVYNSRVASIMWRNGGLALRDVYIILGERMGLALEGPVWAAVKQ